MNQQQIINYLLHRTSNVPLPKNNIINNDGELLRNTFGTTREYCKQILKAVNERSNDNYFDIPDLDSFPGWLRSVVIQASISPNWDKQYLQYRPTWRTDTTTFRNALGTRGSLYTESLSGMTGMVMSPTNNVRQFNGEKVHYTVGGKYYWVQISFNVISVYNGITGIHIKDITIPGSVATPNDKIANACTHPTDPNSIVLPDGNTLKNWNIDDNTISTITTFSQAITVGGTVGDANDFSGNLLAIGFAGEYTVYDLSTDEIVTASGRQAVDGVATEPTFALSNVDYIRVSPDGKNIVLVNDSEQADQGIKLLDFDGQLVDTLYTHDGHVGYALITRSDGKEWNCIVTKMVDNEPIINAKKGDIVSIYWRNEDGTIVKDVRICLSWPDEFSTLSGGQYAYCKTRKVFYLATKYISSEVQVSDQNEGIYYEQILEIDPEGQVGGVRRIASVYGSDTNVQRQCEIFPLFGGQWISYRTPIGTTNAQCYLLAIKVSPRIDEQIIRELL